KVFVLKPPPRRVTSVGKGFLVRELRVSPLDPSSPEYQEVKLPGGMGLSSLDFRWTPAAVSIHNLPNGSFLNPAYREAKVIPLEGEEVVDWSVQRLNPSAGFSFTYVPARYRPYRSLLSPLIGLASGHDWLLFFVSLLVSGSVYKFVIEPTIGKVGKDWAA